MIIPEKPAPSSLRHPEILPIGQDNERLEPALGDLVKEDQWVGEFIERLNHAIAEIVRKK
jgi:hypothetical protein